VRFSNTFGGSNLKTDCVRSVPELACFRGCR